MFYKDFSLRFIVVALLFPLISVRLYCCTQVARTTDNSWDLHFRITHMAVKKVCVFGCVDGLMLCTFVSVETLARIFGV